MVELIEFNLHSFPPSVSICFLELEHHPLKLLIRPLGNYLWRIKGKLNICVLFAVSYSSVNISVTSIGFNSLKVGMCNRNSENFGRFYSLKAPGGGPLNHPVHIAEKPGSAPQSVLLFFTGYEAVSSFNSFRSPPPPGSCLNSFPMS